MNLTFQRYLPKAWSDIFAFVFLLFSIHSIALFEIFVVLPSIYSTETHATPSGSFSLHYFHIAMGVFIYMNVILNLYKIMTTDTSIRGKMLPSVMRPNWRFCYTCESNCPPRSFHCFTCRTCILKRDHHCIFTGNCIGLYNHRYYVCLVAYMWLAAGYSCGLNMDFIYHLMGNLSLKSFLTVLFPLISWIFVQSDKVTSFQVFMTSLSIAGFLLCGGLTVYHMINGVNGQIVHERAINNHTYNLGWKENLAMLFGTKWKIAWLCPLIKSPIPSDGMAFVTKEQYESLKTM